MRLIVADYFDMLEAELLDKAYKKSDQRKAIVQEGSDGEENFQDRKEGSPENRSERKTLSLRQVPQEKSETCKNFRPVVLPYVLKFGIGG